MLTRRARDDGDVARLVGVSRDPCRGSDGLGDGGGPVGAKVVDEHLDAVGGGQVARRARTDRARTDDEDRGSPGQRRSGPLSSRHPPCLGRCTAGPAHAQDRGDQSGQPEGDQGTTKSGHEWWG